MTGQRSPSPVPISAPYGSWRSPITAAMAAVSTTPFSGLVIDGTDLLWCESRPAEGGRYTVMRRSSGGMVTECTSAEFNVRTTVHEYGGGAFAASRGVIYFSNYADGRLYRHVLGAFPTALTAEEGYRYADMICDHKRVRLICVREDHTGASEVVNALVSVGLNGGDDGTILVSGNDFYAYPRLSPDGNQLAYLTWNHPNMPWDGCELRLASVASDGSLDGSRCIAGGTDEAIFQPQWSPDGILHYVAEPTGWWNLYAWRDGTAECLCPMKAEFGRPMWVFGYSTYGFASADRILCYYTIRGADHLAWLDRSTHRLTPIESPYIELEYLQCGQGLAGFVGGAPHLPHTVILFDLEKEEMTPIRPAHEVDVNDRYISLPQEIAVPTAGGEEAYAYYYAPKNDDYAAAESEKPPLIVLSHGGPTSSAVLAFRYMIQYWTSRGFGVVDVNYRGSVGYGRDYRRRLIGQWGIVDVDDCCNAALYLARKGLADRERLAIRGSSAGAYCTFACLTFRSEVFRAGSALYGVADLETFVRDVHKFEAHYLESLVGPYPARQDLYVARSPIHFTERLSCPLILFQGDEDRVVSPSQSERMFAAVRSKGIPTAYLIFHGEQHGFRRAESLKRCYEAELFFYSRIFGFPLSEPIEPVRIENLPPVTRDS